MMVCKLWGEDLWGWHWTLKPFKFVACPVWTYHPLLEDGQRTTEKSVGHVHTTSRDAFFEPPAPVATIKTSWLVRADYQCDCLLYLCHSLQGSFFRGGSPQFPEFWSLRKEICEEFRILSNFPSPFGHGLSFHGRNLFTLIACTLQPLFAACVSSGCCAWHPCPRRHPALLQHLWTHAKQKRLGTI